MRMKFLKNIISLANKLKRGFSLMEIIIAVSASTALILFIVGFIFFMNNGFARLEKKSVNLEKKSYLLKTIALDILNCDTFPHHFVEDYSFSDNNIIFFANRGKVEYDFKDGKFILKRAGRQKEYDFIKAFEIKYFDNNGYMLSENSKPEYCEMNITFTDDAKSAFTLRL